MPNVPPELAAAYRRDLLHQVAVDMESTAKRETLPDRRWFESRARRIRERLEHGVPPRWTVPSKME
jgi:hypothetical protein